MALAVISSNWRGTISYEWPDRQLEVPLKYRICSIERENWRHLQLAAPLNEGDARIARVNSPDMVLKARESLLVTVIKIKVGITTPAKKSISEVRNPQHHPSTSNKALQSQSSHDMS